MGTFFLVFAVVMYLVSFAFAVNGVSAIGVVIVATLFVVCSVLCHLGESVDKQLNGIAHNLAWFKETRLKETQEQQESRRSRGQR